MSTFWRIALAWMLALALPLQGHAAQRLLACATAPASAMAPLAAVAGHVHDPHALHVVHASPGHHAAAPGDHPVDSAKCSHSCSACASCCHAAALPTAVPQWAAMPPAMPEAPALEQAPERVWLDGLERPPRPSMR